MQQPNQRGGFRQPQGFNPNAIRTKKHQLDKNTYGMMAVKHVWKKEWWYALIPLLLFLLPAVFSFSWLWVAGAVLVTLLFVLLRSVQVMSITQVEQGNPLFEKLMYEIDQKQLLLKKNDREGMTISWDMIATANQKDEAFYMWLQAPKDSQLPGGWKGWLAKTFQVPVFLHLPYRIFNSPNDIKLMESLLRRKNLLKA